MGKSIEDMFAKALRFRNDGRLDESKAALLEIVKLNSDNPQLVTVYIVLGGVLYDQREFRESIKYSKKASSLMPGSELASLCAYLSYVELQQYDDAINELDRFLSTHSADHYKTTLRELLGDLKNGYARDHESVIVRLSKRHGVSII